MCGGRGDDSEHGGKEATEATEATEALAGAGRSGGGEERVGDPLAEASGAVVLFAPARFSPSSLSSLVSMSTGLSVPGEETSMCPLCPFLFAGRGPLMASLNDKVLLWRGLCCSTESHDGEEG